MRDTIKSDGIKKLIEEIESELPLIVKDIEDSKTVEVKLKLKRLYFSSLLELTIAYYSSGASKEVVTTALSKAIDSFSDCFKWNGFENTFGGYDIFIWMLSLSILCGVDNEYFAKVVSVIERDKVKDKLIDFLIKYKDPSWKGDSGNFVQKEPYSSISKTIDEPTEANGIQSLKAYLNPNVWYVGHSDAYWHDLHKAKRSSNYFGYWAWEAAALVKAKGWNDEALKGTDYYPYDAVHW